MASKHLIFIENKFVGNLNGYITTSPTIFDIIKEIFCLLDNKKIKYTDKFIADLSKEFDELPLEELNDCYNNLIHAIIEGSGDKKYISDIPRKNPYYWSEYFTKNFTKRLSEKYYDVEQKEDLVECSLENFAKQMDQLIELKIEKNKKEIEILKESINEDINFVKNNQIDRFLYVKSNNQISDNINVDELYSDILGDKYGDIKINNMKDYNNLKSFNDILKKLKTILINEKEYLKYLKIIEKLKILIKKELISKEDFKNISTKYKLENKKTKLANSYLKYIQKNIYFEVNSNLYETNYIVLNDENYTKLKELFAEIMNYINKN